VPTLQWGRPFPSRMNAFVPSQVTNTLIVDLKSVMNLAQLLCCRLLRPRDNFRSLHSNDEPCGLLKLGNLASMPPGEVWPGILCQIDVHGRFTR